MKIVKRLLGNPSEENEVDLEWEERPVESVKREFVRKTVRFVFVRGGEEEITYDSWTESGRNRGRTTHQRGDVRVERFYRIIGGTVGTYDGEVGVFTGGYTEGKETVGEVTIANVAYREVLDERDMVIEVPTVRMFGIHPETGEVMKKGWRKKDTEKEIKIREVNEEKNNTD